MQVVSLPDDFKDAHEAVEKLRSEYVVAVTGTLRERSNPNPKVVGYESALNGFSSIFPGHKFS